MVRKSFPAQAHDQVKSALDAVRVTLAEIGEWLRDASPNGRPISSSTLNNYRDGRREMPAEMRRLLARQLREHARKLKAHAKRIENSAKTRAQKRKAR